MASLQHIDEPIIGLFYSGPTGYCDSVSVMKESRFSSYFFVSAEWLTQRCQSGVASLCCNLPFCDGVRIFPRRLWRLLSDWNTISCLLICHLDFGVCPTSNKIRQSQIKTAACSLLRDFQRECVPGHVVPNQITTEAHCPMKSRYTVEVHFR